MNIELKDFITETLKAIISGVSAAQNHAADEGAAINPHGLMASGDGYAIRATGIVVQKVEFDIAVETVERNEVEAGVGFMVTVFGAGFRAGEETTLTGMNRVSFSVPIRLPLQRG